MTHQDFGKIDTTGNSCEVVVGTYFHMWHGTKATPVFLHADREACSDFDLRTIRLHNVARKHLFLYP